MKLLVTFALIFSLNIHAKSCEDYLMTPPRRSNCLIYALNRWRHDGGYIIMRKSHHGWWPHFMWTGDLGELEITEYTPLQETIAYADKLQIPPPIFCGYVRTGTDRKKDSEK